MPLPLLAWAAGAAVVAAGAAAYAAYSSDDDSSDRDSSNSKSKEDAIKRQQEEQQRQKRERQAQELNLKKQKTSAFLEKHFKDANILVKLKKEVDQAKNTGEISAILKRANTQYKPSRIAKLIHEKAASNQRKRELLAAVAELKKIRGE